MKRKLVLFDIDGTILLTAGAGRRAILAAMSEEVPDVAPMATIRFDGKTDPQIVAEMLEMAGSPEARESARVQGLCRRYVGYLARELERPASKTTLMPGIPELLDRLEEENGRRTRPAHRECGRRRGAQASLRGYRSRLDSASARTAPMRAIVRNFLLSPSAARFRSSGVSPPEPKW